MSWSTEAIGLEVVLVSQRSISPRFTQPSCQGSELIEAARKNRLSVCGQNRPLTRGLNLLVADLA
ncbi:hypothetical protein RESH_01932 [Rhodopirellula europaea SH398]|uniref:Uncharacterized protein n=1 Tax=Rhodopirellula europaea SH398 TaxID=1263868 RepID=M5S7Q7_9BACT|nr:hypothetical protein RESH_01932 [Rhodopirellula europaea SH398]